ncbi:MAG: diacylglycerol kinase family protein [Bacteroidota bacterium]
MASSSGIKILFVINPGSGNNNTDWAELISRHFNSRPEFILDIIDLGEKCDLEDIRKKIKSFQPSRVIAVGGDGTVKMVAECVLNSDIVLGILPAGSANGMAKELAIPEKPIQALDIITEGMVKKIHATTVNDHLCVHLSDIGFNAFLIKKFDTLQARGMWGYMKASFKVMLNNPKMDVEIMVDNHVVRTRAAMVVIANATKYGSGAVINPVGKLDDELFEVVALKKISIAEIFKMTFLNKPHNTAKMEVFQTTALTIRSKKRVHFQVDGEYLGKVGVVKAEILPHSLAVLVPAEK